MDLSAINPILLVAALMSAATPILLAATGELVVERAGVLNLGVEGTMYAGAFFGFAVAYQTGDTLIGLLGAIVVGLIAGALMALMTACCCS